VIGSEVGWKESRFSLVGIFYGWWSVGIEDNLRIGSEKWRYKPKIGTRHFLAQMMVLKCYENISDRYPLVI
jgi:hypothetical protein